MRTGEVRVDCVDCAFELGDFALRALRSENVALKKMVFDNDDEGIPSTALREVSLLKELTGCPNVVALLEVMYAKKTLYLVFPFLDHDLKHYMETVGIGPDLARVRAHCRRRALNFSSIVCLAEICMAVVKRHSVLSSAKDLAQRPEATEHTCAN
jgi:serine/threonine protein kinase